MQRYTLTHLADSALLRDLAAIVARDRATTAVLLAHLAEVDARRLYLPAGFPSMFEYCVRELGLSEDAAFKRIRAARAARRFPELYAALAGGRLHLSGAVLLAPYLTPENAAELIAAAGRKSKAEIELMLAQRFPRPDVPERLAALPVSRQLAPGPVAVSTGGSLRPAPGAFAGGRQGTIGRTVPLAPARFALQVTLDQETHDMLQRARGLVSHRVPSGDLAQVLHQVLRAALPALEKRKFAAIERPRAPRAARAGDSGTRRAAVEAPTADFGHSGQPVARDPARHGTARRGARRLETGTRRAVPARVKRAVWARDGGECTFVSNRGLRCPARHLLEFDHVLPVARGGGASVADIRMRCRAHNQYEAERAFGAAFMRGKREASRRGRTLDVASREVMASRSDGQLDADSREVVACLRALGCTTAEARRAVLGGECSGRVSIGDAPAGTSALENTTSVPRSAEDMVAVPRSLEERVRLALTRLGSKPRAHGDLGRRETREGASAGC